MSPAAETKLIMLAALREAIRVWQEAGETVVLAEGVFDLLTVAHVRRLATARAQGDRLVVVVREAALASRSSEAPPLVDARDRALLVASLRGVDRVALHLTDEEEARRLAGVLHVGCEAEDAAAEALKASIRTRHAGV